MDTEHYTFQQFIAAAVDREKLSVREFARRVDMSPTTIARWMDETQPPKPELAQLVKIAEYTGVGIETLVGMAYPDVADKTRTTPLGRLVGQNFERLPKNIQDAVLTLIQSTK